MLQNSVPSSPWLLPNSYSNSAGCRATFPTWSLSRSDTNFPRSKVLPRSTRTEAIYSCSTSITRAFPLQLSNNLQLSTKSSFFLSPFSSSFVRAEKAPQPAAPLLSQQLQPVTDHSRPYLIREHNSPTSTTADDLPQLHLLLSLLELSGKIQQDRRCPGFLKILLPSSGRLFSWLYLKPVSTFAPSRVLRQLSIAFLPC